MKNQDPKTYDLHELRKYLRDVKQGYKTLELEDLSLNIVLAIYSGVSLEELYESFNKYSPKLSARAKARMMKKVLAEFKRQKSLKQSRLEQTCVQSSP